MRLTQAAAAVLGVWLSFGVVTALGGDWSSIMRDEPVIIKGAAVREEDGDHPRKATEPQYLKAGTKFLEGGYWYTADGNGRGAWCAECNGISYADFVRQWEAKRTPVMAGFVQGQPANPPRPGGSPGYPPSTPGTTVRPVTIPLQPGRELGWSAGTMPMAPTPMFAQSAPPRGGIRFAGSYSGGCATGG